MSRKIFHLAAFSYCLFFLIALTSKLDGHWTGKLVIPDGNSIDVAYTFITDGETLTGTAESPYGTTSVDNGKVVDNKFSFDVIVSGTVYPHKGVLYTDSCGIDVDFGGGMMAHTTVLRDSARLK